MNETSSKTPLITQILLALVILGSLFYLLSLAPWRSLLRVDKVSEKTEEKLGNLYEAFIKRTENLIENPAKTEEAMQLFRSICEANEIDFEGLQIYFIRSSLVNAFAMPGNQMVIYTGLVDACDHEGELAGVFAHELAHLQKRHVMKKLVRELGVGALVGMASGGGGATVAEAIKILSSMSYSRELEREADEYAVLYMEKAGLSAEYFAEFMFKISEMQNIPEEFMIISSHPHSEERTLSIINQSQINKEQNTPILSTDEWLKLKTKLSYSIKTQEEYN